MNVCNDQSSLQIHSYFVLLFTVMPPAPPAAAIALYQLRLDWETFQNLPQSDGKKKLLNSITTDSSRKNQPPAKVYADKLEKALRHASRMARNPPPAACPTSVGEPTSVKDGSPPAREQAGCPSSDVGSRLSWLEQQIHELRHQVTTLNTTTMAQLPAQVHAGSTIIIRNDGFCAGGITCTASHVEWDKQRSCGIVDCLLLWSNQSWSAEAVEAFDKHCLAHEGPCPKEEPREVRIWQQMFDNSADVLLVVEKGNYLQYQHLLHHSPPRENGPVVYVDVHQRAFLLSGLGLMERFRQRSTGASASPAPKAESSLPNSSNAPTVSSASTPSTAICMVQPHIDDLQLSVIDLTAAPRRRTPLGASKRKSTSTDTTGTPAIKKARPLPLGPPPGNELVKRLGAEISTLPVVDHDGRCALAAVLVALNKSPTAIEQCRRDLAKRLEQWTKPMWVEHVPARLRQRHWRSGGQRSSFHTYLDLLGGSLWLDQCVLYLASIEYKVDIHIVTAGVPQLTHGKGKAHPGQPSLTVAHIQTESQSSQHIVLLHTRDDHYEVIQHHRTSVFDNDQRKLLTHQLPNTTWSAIADPEVDEPELEKGGYENAPTLIGQGAFARVYRVATKDLCAQPRWHALKIVTDKQAVKMAPHEATALKRMAAHPGVPRLWQVVGERALSMEYCVGGSLEDAMDTHLPVPVCMEVFRQIMCTLRHAHKIGLLHRDVKPANILLRHKLARTSTIHDVDVVLADWGLAITTADKQGKGCMFGTRKYLPPEVLLDELPFDATCDVWAAGYVLAQLLRGGRPLFTGELMPNWHEQLDAKLNTIPRDDIRSLLRAVLSPRSERPDASKVLLMLPSVLALQVE